jgi:Ser/Thr protein kinase RdoA (MazF antagonist)
MDPVRPPSPSPAYTALDVEGQVEVLRRVALAAADEFGLRPRELSLVLHAYNTTFRVDTDDDRRLALRVNTNSHSTPANILAQQTWLHALATETEVLVPHPVATPDGRWTVAVPSPGWRGPLHVTVATWLEGEDVGVPDDEQARALGRAMALLHDHAEGFHLPDRADLPVFDTPLFGDEDLVAAHPSLSADAARLVADAVAEADGCFAEAYADHSPILLHADLHGGNLKWHHGRLAVFDVDDCGFGVPALDLAIATFYLRDGSPGAEAALRAGYAGVRLLPEVADDVFEGLVAARQLLLANSLLASSTADLRAEGEEYLVVTVERLRHWRRTGRFSRSLPGAGGS